MFEEDTEILFGAFSGEPDSLDQDLILDPATTASTIATAAASKKRTLDSVPTNGKSDIAGNGTSKLEVDGDTIIEMEPVPKKAKRGFSPQPVVADEFQQESSREVAVIAGLQGESAAAGAAGLVLSHQVIS